MPRLAANFSARARSRAATATTSASGTLVAGLVRANGVIFAAPSVPMRTVSIPRTLVIVGAMSQVTVTEPADGVVVLTLERPEKKNALSIAVRDEMSDALDLLVKDEGVKVVIITGAGDVFCAGFDL